MRLRNLALGAFLMLVLTLGAKPSEPTYNDYVQKAGDLRALLLDAYGRADHSGKYGHYLAKAERLAAKENLEGAMAALEAALALMQKDDWSLDRAKNPKAYRADKLKKKKDSR